MTATGWQNKTASGIDAYNDLCNWISRHRYVKWIWRIWTAPRGGPAQGNPDGRALVGKALQALIGDMGAKERKSASAGDRNFQSISRDELDEEEDDKDN